MKTFLIKEQFKKTISGSKGLYRVFILEDDIETDITKSVAELWNREEEYDWINLTIYYWDWGGGMIISEILKENWWYDIDIVDMPMF